MVAHRRLASLISSRPAKSAYAKWFDACMSLITSHATVRSATYEKTCRPMSFMRDQPTIAARQLSLYRSCGEFWRDMR